MGGANGIAIPTWHSPPWPTLGGEGGKGTGNSAPAPTGGGCMCQ